MNKPKTQKQIDVEIATLKNIKPKVRRFTAFGDDNWAKIDIQINVLENDLDEDDISQYTDPDENSEAYNTIQWRNGEFVDESPSDGWKP